MSDVSASDPTPAHSGDLPTVEAGSTSAAPSLEDQASSAAQPAVPNPRTEPVDYKRLWNLNDSHYLIMASRVYAVWLSANNNLDWQTQDSLDIELSAKLNGSLNAIYNTVAVLKAYPTSHLSDVVQKTFYVMIGEGLARSFEFDVVSASQMLQNAREYVVARSQELARVWYLCATGIATAIPAILLLVGWLNRSALAKYFGENTSYLLLGCCAGGLGAFLSILTRVGSTPLDPAAGQLLHNLEGIGRIAVGVLGAAIVQLAVKVGWLLPMLAEKGHGGLFLVAIVAGASERLVPTLIRRVEMDGTASGNGAPPTHR